MTKMRYRNNPLQLAIDNYAKVVSEMKNPFAESQTPTHKIDCQANNCLDSFCDECCECGAV